MSDNRPSVQPIGTNESRREFVEFLRTASDDLFEPEHEPALEAAILQLTLSQVILETDEFPSGQINNLAYEFSLKDEESRRLQIVRLILRANHRSASSSEGEEEEEEEEPEEDPNDETDISDEEQNEIQAAQKLMEFMRDKFTYYNEIRDAYFRFIDKHPRIKKFHDSAVEAKAVASTFWAKTKATIKSGLSWIGVESVFIWIEKLSNRNSGVKHILKIIGTPIGPISLVIILIFKVLRWAANPVQRFFRWLAREFNIKMPVGDDEEGAV